MKFNCSLRIKKVGNHELIQNDKDYRQTTQTIKEEHNSTFSYCCIPID